MARAPCIHHCTSEPYRFFGRAAELALLDAALGGGRESVVALIGPGGQGKTAIVQHWLEALLSVTDRPDGVFLWSFYRGKDADLCMRADYLRVVRSDESIDLGMEYRDLLEAYDRGGLPFERALTRLRYAAWLRAQGQTEQAKKAASTALDLARQYGMRILEADSLVFLSYSPRLAGGQPPPGKPGAI